MVDSPSEKESHNDKSARLNWGAYMMGLSPVWVLLAVMGIYGMVYSILIQCVWIEGCCQGVPEISQWISCLLQTPEKPISATILNGFAGRINWTVATGLNLCLSILTLVLAGYIAMRAGRYYPYGRGLLPILLFSLSAGVGYVMKKKMSSGGGL